MIREKVREKIADIISDKLPEDPSIDEFLLVADEILSISELKEYFVSEAREALEKIETYPDKYIRYLWNSYNYEGLLSSMRTVAIITLAKLEAPK